MSSKSINVTSVADFETIFPPSDFSLDDKDCLKAGSTLTSTDCMYKDASSSALRALCHFEECTTQDSEACKFPFRYKGRLYDSCIIIDSLEAWCSTKTDVNYNHIDGPNTRGKCSSSCKITHCPVGYFLFNRNCFSFSGMNENDAWASVEESSEYCQETGARLYQPRDIVSLELLKIFKTFKPEGPHLLHKTSISIMSIGGVLDSLTPELSLEYLDGSKGYVYEMLLESPVTSTISDIASYSEDTCIAINQDGELSLDVCSGFNSLKETVGNGNHLTYLCEAKLIMTIGGPDPGKSCSFPFKASENDNASNTCLFDYINEGSWCATEVDKDGLMIPGKWGSCQDEREIAIVGEGAGKQCMLPFLFDRVWQSKCVMDPRDKYWCPTSLDISREFNEGNDEFGYCTEFLYPSITDCPLNYENVGGKCIRVSPYPEDFQSAQFKCQSEGANLLSIMDDSYTNILKAYVTNLESTRSYFHPSLSPDLTSYWIGASVRNFQWSWIGTGQNLSSYSNWLEGTENKGCIQLLCTDNYALAIQVEKRYHWMAEDQSKPKPYICESTCRVGYNWHKNLQKCLKIVQMGQGKTRAKAMLSCAEENSRLLSIRYCNDFEKIGKDAFLQLHSTSEEYWLGYFAGEFKSYKSARTNNLQAGTVDSRGRLSPHNCTCIDGNVDDLAKNGDYSGIFTYNSDLASDISVKLSIFNEKDDDVVKGYICEPENDWSCPEDYIMFQESCYKISMQPLTFSGAHLDCQLKSGHLLRIDYSAQSHFIQEYAKSKSNESPLWVSNRQNIYSGNEDKSYSTLTLEEEDIEGISGLLCKYTC